MALSIIYETVVKFIIKVYKVFNYVVYTLWNNYVCIEYPLCQSRIICSISNNPVFNKKSFNLLPGFGIPELLPNLVSYHGFMISSNSTVIIICWSCLIDKYLLKNILSYW